MSTTRNHRNATNYIQSRNLHIARNLKRIQLLRIILLQIVLARWKNGDRKDAIEMQGKVLKTKEKNLGDEHPDTLMSKRNLEFMSGS